MKKLIAIVMMALAVVMVGCGSSDKGSKDSKIVKEAKEELQHYLDKNFKVGTKAENQNVVYESETDSICVIDFTGVYTLASGREYRGEMEYVFYPKASHSNFKGFLMDLSKEKSVIEQAKDFSDEVEMNTSPKDRAALKGWEESVKWVVMMLYPKKYIESPECEEELQNEYNLMIQSESNASN